LLKPPSKKFGSLTLPVTDVDASSLLRISSYNTGEPFFGKTKKNRFDDPRKMGKARRFGTCYTGFTLECAFAETVLHNRVAVNGGFEVPVSELENPFVVSFKAAPLCVAVLVGTELKTLGGDGELSTITPYDIPQKWSLAVHKHPARVDGLVYMSKHVNNQYALMLFDRAKPKLIADVITPFPDFPGSLRTTMRLKVTPK
jgi:hypothetical protein